MHKGGKERGRMVDQKWRKQLLWGKVGVTDQKRWKTWF